MQVRRSKRYDSNEQLFQANPGWSCNQVGLEENFAVQSLYRMVLSQSGLRLLPQFKS